MATTIKIPEQVEQKLAAFERIQPEFEACFRFIQTSFFLVEYLGRSRWDLKDNTYVA